MLQNLLKTSLFILSLVLATSLLGSSSVNAQSAYDDIYLTTNTLTLERTGCSTMNLENNWGGQVLQRENYGSDTDYNTANDSWDMKTAWYVTQVHNNEIRVGLSSVNNPSLEWHQEAVNAVGGHRLLVYTMLEDCSLRIMVRFSNTPYLTKIWGDPTYNFLAYGYDPNYPDDYVGEQIVEEYIPPIETEKIGVSIRGSVAEDIVQVEWYNDPTNPKPDEAQGMYLVLHNINFDEIPPECSNQDIQEWRHNLDEIAIFNPVPCYGMWYVQSYYTSDPQGQNIIPDTDKTNLNLRIDGGSFYFDYSEVEYDEDGSIISPPISGVNMANCVVFTEGLPYVEFNYQGCFSNIQKFIGIASTNNANVSRQFENIAIPAHQACGSFTKFNNFLHISDENNWLCPQLTEELRQPITLFAVFILYIIAMFGWFYLMSGRV